jgi:hypothetical protein
MSVLGKIFRPWVLTALAAVAAYVIQLSPMPGVVLMMMGAILWPGALIHITLVLIIVDVWRRRAHPIFLALPVAFYSAGIGAAVLSRYDAWRLERHVDALSSEAPIAFDPQTQAVVFARNESGNMGQVHEHLLAAYKLDVAYAPRGDDNGEIRSTRIVPRAQCPERPMEGGSYRRFFRVGAVRITNACMINAPERIDRPPIIVSSTESEERWGFFDATITRTEIRSGLTTHVVATAETQVYPFLPAIFAGCALNSGGPSWECVHGLRSSRREVGGRGGPGDTRRINAIAAALDLQPRVVTGTGEARLLQPAPGTIDIASAPEPAALR